MSRFGITYEDVSKAAEDIFKNGEAPTIDRIRMLLGTGSFSTISKYLNAWRHGMTPKESFTIKNQKSDIVHIAVERVWQQIREETDTEIETIKEETQKLLNEIQATADNALKRSEELEKLYANYQETFNALHAAKEIQELDFKKLRHDYAILQERYKGLDERYTEFQRIAVKHQEDMVQAHKNELNRVFEKLKLQEESHQKLISEMKENQENQRHLLIVERDSLKAENQKLKKTGEETVKLKAEINAISKERDRLTHQISSQSKYWDLIEKNSQLTNSIWSEVKDIPKFDVTLSTINYLSLASSSLSSSVQELDKFSNETKSFFEKYTKNSFLDDSDK